VAGRAVRVGRPDSHGRVVWQPVGSRSESRIGVGMRGSNDLAHGLRHTRPVACYGSGPVKYRNEGEREVYALTRVVGKRIADRARTGACGLER
jgi:hypothetical protein